MGRVFFYCEFYVSVIRVHGFQELVRFVLGFLGENIINIPVVERWGSRSDYVVFKFGHEYVCNHRRQRVTHTTPINLFIQIPIEGEGRTLCNFLKESFKDALVGQMRQLVFIVDLVNDIIYGFFEGDFCEK